MDRPWEAKLARLETESRRVGGSPHAHLWLPGPSQLLQLMGEETGLRVNKRRRQNHRLHAAAGLWRPQQPPLGTGQLAALMPCSLFLAPRSKNTLLGLDLTTWL